MWLQPGPVRSPKMPRLSACMSPLQGQPLVQCAPAAGLAGQADPLTWPSQPGPQGWFTRPASQQPDWTRPDWTRTSLLGLLEPANRRLYWLVQSRSDRACRQQSRKSRAIPVMGNIYLHNKVDSIFGAQKSTHKVTKYPIATSCLKQNQ